MTEEDVEMVEKIDEWLSMQYQQTNSSRRNKRFGLATWVLGWGIYRTYSTIRHIKDNIRTLQEKNLLQQDQIIELSHYLNITYGHVSSNCYRNWVRLKCNGILNYKLSLKYYKSSPLLAPWLQHMGKHAPLSLLTP